MRVRLLASLFFAALLGLAPSAKAVDMNPGDSCSGFPAGAYRPTGGQENPDGALVVCDGTIWQPILRYSSAGNAVMFSSTGLPAAPVHVWGEAIIGNQGLACGDAQEGALRYTSASDSWEYCDGASWLDLASGSGAPSAAGADRQIQFNSGGSLGADANFVFTSVRRLGIGTANPRGSVDVASGTAYFDRIRGDNNAWINFSPGGQSHLEFFTANNLRMKIFNSGVIKIGDSVQNVLLQEVGGNVGIGTTSPAVPLDVSGIMRAVDDAAGCTSTERGALRFNSAGGALQLCDGASWGSVGSGGAGLWSDSGSGYIEYDSALGGMRVGDISGEPAPNVIGVTNLNDLGDVSVGSPSDQEVLTYDTGTGEWIAGAGAAGDFIGLTDTPSAYTGAAGQFAKVNATPDGLEFGTIGLGDLPAIALNDLSDATISSPAADEVLSYDGSNWVNGALTLSQLPTIALNDLSDTNLNSPAAAQALYYDGSGWINQALAIDDLTDGISDGSSVFLGANAGVNDDGGNNNTALGIDALQFVSSGIWNTAVGYQALQNYTGGHNTAVGWRAARNVTGDTNVALGRQALHGAVGATGWSNVAVGVDAMLNNDAGSFNTAVGWLAMRNNTDGENNIAMGRQALVNNTTGDANVALGKFALVNNTTGQRNVAVGYEAMGFWSAIDGDMDHNTAIGYHAGYNIEGGTEGAGGNNNVLLGYQAGDVITTGDHNIIIGYDVDPSSATASNELNIGDTIYGDLSAGNVGVGTSTPQSKLDVNGEVQVGDSGAGCTSSNEGAQRYNGTEKRMEFCDGSAWKEFGGGAVPTAGDILADIQELVFGAQDGWEEVEDVYDYASDGAVTSAETSVAFAAGYEYALVARGVSSNYGLNGDVDIEAYFATAATYMFITRANLSEDVDTATQFLMVRNPAVSATDFPFLSGTFEHETSPDAGTTFMGFFTVDADDTISKIRVIETRGGEIDAGTIKLYRRPL